MTILPCSLIIPTRNRPRLLAHTVASVLQGDAVPAELVVIDQSNAPLARLGELPNPGNTLIRYIHSASIGVSRARNEGAAAAQFDLLVFIDDDMEVPADWLGVLVAALAEAGSGAVVTGQVLPNNEQIPGGFVPALVESPLPATYSGRIGTDVLPSCHMALYRSAYTALGGFDVRLGPGTRYPAADDNDFGFRLLESGFHIIYTPQASVIHRAWRSGKEYYRLRWNYGRGKGGFYTKYWSLRDRYMLGRMTRDVLLRLVRFPWRVLHRPQLATGDLVYAAGIASGSASWLWNYKVREAANRLAALFNRAKGARNAK